MATKDPARMARHRKFIARGLAVVLVLAVLGMVFFAARAMMVTSAWHNHPNPQDPIAGWMTPRYISRSWQVPPEIVAQALALETDGSGRKVTLAELAAERGTDLDALTAALTAAIAAYLDQPDD